MARMISTTAWRLIIGLSLSFVPCDGFAGTFYKCIDGDGEETLSDHQVAGQRCRPVIVAEETAAPESEEASRRSAEPSDAARSTKVTIRRNSIYVPVTLQYGGNEVTANLLIDTGASSTMIYSEVADQLLVNLRNTRKVKASIVGGGVIEANVVKMNSLTVGPHTTYNKFICVVPHEGPGQKIDGLLGLDVLRNLKFTIDFKSSSIIWD